MSEKVEAQEKKRTDEFGAMYSQIHKDMFRWARILMDQNDEDANDLVQDAAETALKKYREGKIKLPDGEQRVLNFRKWMFTHLKFTALQNKRTQRTQRRGGGVTLYIEDLNVVGDVIQDANPYAAEVSVELQDVFNQAREVLTQAELRSLSLIICGLQYNEAAKLLGEKEQHVKDRVSIARRKMCKLRDAQA